MSEKHVLDRHLQRAANGEVEQDIEENYAAEAVILAAGGAHGVPRRYQGSDGVRRLREELASSIGPDARVEIQTKLVDGEMALIRWTAHGSRGRVVDGVDSFLIRDGRIHGQTINYTVGSANGSANEDPWELAE